MNPTGLRDTLGTRDDCQSAVVYLGIHLLCDGLTVQSELNQQADNGQVVVVVHRRRKEQSMRSVYDIAAEIEEQLGSGVGEMHRHKLCYSPRAGTPRGLRHPCSSISGHSLRRGAATTARRNGADPISIARGLGWADGSSVLNRHFETSIEDAPNLGL